MQNVQVSSKNVYIIIIIIEEGRIIARYSEP